MAHITDHAPATGFLSRLWEGLIALGENSARAQTLQKISTMSDEQINALGLTRAQLVQRALSAGGL